MALLAPSILESFRADLEARKAELQAAELAHAEAWSRIYKLDELGHTAEAYELATTRGRETVAEVVLCTEALIVSIQRIMSAVGA